MLCLQTSRLLLRPWRSSDLEDLVLFANNPKIAAYLRDAFPFPYTHEEGRRFLAYAAQLPETTLLLALEHQGRPCGSIGLFPQADIYRRNAEIGYWLAEPLWGQGLMLEAIHAVVAHAFQTPEIVRLFAAPFSANLASQRLLQKAGFRKEAVFSRAIFKAGVFHDEVIYALVREMIPNDQEAKAI